MKTIRSKSGPFSERPHFQPSEIDRICADELRKAGLYPASPQAIRVDRFVEKRFGVAAEYEELPAGVLGYTRFSKSGVEAIIISAALDAEKTKVAERRIRTTLAHEAGHGLLHAYLFALDNKPLHLFDADSHTDHQILCRDILGEERKTRAYDGRWWEFQANCAIGGYLLPNHLFRTACEKFLVPVGSLGMKEIPPEMREVAARELSEIFDVNPKVVSIRLDTLFPASSSQQEL